MHTGKMWAFYVCLCINMHEYECECQWMSVWFWLLYELVDAWMCGGAYKWLGTHLYDYDACVYKHACLFTWTCMYVSTDGDEYRMCVCSCRCKTSSQDVGTDCVYVHSFDCPTSLPHWQVCSASWLDQSFVGSHFIISPWGIVTRGHLLMHLAGTQRATCRNP